jgi:hypothetical protein
VFGGKLHVDTLKYRVDITTDLNFIVAAIAGDKQTCVCRRLWRLTQWLESNGNVKGERNANDSLAEDCDTWTAAYELCGHQYRPDTGSATGFGSNR